MQARGRVADTARPPYFTPAEFARRTFGGPVARVSVDAGFSCPVRDGTLSTDGCLFCTIDGFRPPTSRPELPLCEQVARGFSRVHRRYPRAIGFLVYLQPYTNTHGPLARVERVLAEARSIAGARGIIVATRPDALPEPILDLLAREARRTFLQVELGVQSTDDATLRAMRRGHTWDDSRRAIRALRQRGVRIGAHMILATPWEPVASQIAGAQRLSAEGVQAVKLHHLQVLRGSQLARLAAAEPIALPDWQAYAQIAAAFLECLDPGIVVERLFSRAPRELLIAPRWEVAPTRVREEISRILRAHGSTQGARWIGGSHGPDPAGHLRPAEPV